MNSPIVFQIMALFGLAIVLVSFMVIAKTMGNIGISLLRMEYLLKRELELVKERERIKSEIMRQQRLEEDRRRRMEDEEQGIPDIPSPSVKKEKA